MSYRVPSNVARCRECKATVVWVTMSYGKPRMVDLEPSAFGNVLVAFTDKRDSRGHVIRIAAKLDDQTAKLAHEQGGIPLFRFHTETCPNSRARELAHR